MAITDDVPDGSTQEFPLLNISHAFPAFAAIGQNAVKLSVAPLSTHMPCTEAHQHHCSDASGAMSLLFRDNRPLTQSHQCVYQTDSPAAAAMHNDMTDSCNQSDETYVHRDTFTMCEPVLSAPDMGRDAFMKCEPVLTALEMGFDHEMIRTVVHLKMVQSGENYSTSSDLVEALLAYIVAMTDVASRGDNQQQQQQREVKEAEMITTSSSQTGGVSCDVTDGASSAVAAAASPSPSVAHRKQPAKKKRPRRNKNPSSTNSSSRSTRSLTETRFNDSSRLVCHSTKLDTFTSDAGGAERLPWEIEMENKQLKAAKTCKICLEADIEVVFIPCGHLVSCRSCASLVARCSLCGATVTDSVKIYMN